MCSLYSVLFFLGLALLQLPTTVASCPPSNPPVGAKTIQFCSGSEVTSNTIYIDSSDVSNRVTNCTCIFNARNDTTVLVTTTTNQITDCRTNIKYGQHNGVLTHFCGTIFLTQPIETGFNHTLLLTNGLMGLKTYCLKLIPGINGMNINIKCFQDTHVTTATTTSTEPPVNKDTTVSDSTSGASTTGTTDTGTQTSKITVQHSATSTGTDENKSPVLYILLLTTIGSLLLIGCIILVGVVYIRRCSKTKNVYESSGTTSDLHVYENHISTTTVEENNHDVTEYENFNFNKHYTDLTNTTVNNEEGYTELQLLPPNYENTMSPSTYTELQTAAVDIDHGYTQLNPDTDSKNQSNSEVTNGDYKKVKATV